MLSNPWTDSLWKNILLYFILSFSILFFQFHSLRFRYITFCFVPLFSSPFHSFPYGPFQSVPIHSGPFYPIPCTRCHFVVNENNEAKLYDHTIGDKIFKKRYLTDPPEEVRYGVKKKTDLLRIKHRRVRAFSKVLF